MYLKHLKWVKKICYSYLLKSEMTVDKAHLFICFFIR